MAYSLFSLPSIKYLKGTLRLRQYTGLVIARSIFMQCKRASAPPGRSETVGDTKTEERGGQETVQTDAGFVSTGRRHNERGTPWQNRH